MHSSSSSATPVVRPWRARSIPIDKLSMRHKLCGLLNRVTKANFDAICDQVVEWAVRIDRSWDPEALALFVRLIFDRGLSDHSHCSLYASLCQRIVDELEGDRSLWKKVDPYHLGNPVNSFETDIRLLAHDEFHRVIHAGEPGRLITSMSFAGELIVHGVVFAEDLQEAITALFDYAEQDDQEKTVALCRFLARLVRAFDAYRILSSLQVVDRVEEVLKKDNLSQRTRYLLMCMLEQVVFPRPQDAFSSTRDRIDVYGVELDDSDAGSVDAEDSDIDNGRIQRTCSMHASMFIVTHDHAQTVALLQALKPIHRTILVQELVSAAIDSNDTGEALAVGSLLSLGVVNGLCEEDNSLVKGLVEGLSWLEDSMLDVPHAPRLLAYVLHGTGLPFKMVESIATQSPPRESNLMEALLTDVRNLEDFSGGETEAQESADDTARQNRFERNAIS